MIRSNDVDISNFITFTPGGIKIAEFTQVRDALINRYKEVYGSDIDLSTGTTDGVFINDLALIINNILQSYKNLYANLNVNTASGQYLDALCALSNVTRIPESRSVASLNITNNGDSPYLEESGTTFVDKNGTEWLYNEPLSLQPGETKSIQVECGEFGPIAAPKNWIDRTLELTSLAVVQPNSASLGEYAESDSHLRNRRAQSTGASGITVLESLTGALLAVAGIKDVYIYNNFTGTTPTISDGSTLATHSIYVTIRYGEGISIDDSTIGKIIYEKMTPGINTSEPAANLSNTGEKKEYNYTPVFDGISLSSYNTMVYWKKAIPLHPTITLNIKGINNFSINQLDIIGEAVKNYLNNLYINADITETNILVEATGTDTYFLGRPTFLVDGITIEDAVSGTYSNKFTYYYYNKITTTDEGNSEYTITIEYEPEV